MNVLRRFLGFHSLAADVQAQPEPKLPPEIWLKVFDYATHIPGAYTCDDGPALLAYAADQHGIALHSRHREATNTMLSASLVCKAWTPVAAEFLFRYLLVKSGKHAVKIAKTLDNFAIHPLRSSLPSRFTLQLEIFLEGVHRWDMSHTFALTYILSVCPNIRVFSTAFMSWACDLTSGDSNSKGHDALFEAVLPALAPDLESLVLIPLNARGCKSALTFPKLRVFVLQDRWAIPLDNDPSTIPSPPFRMPVLRALHLSLNSSTDSDFFRTVAGQLEYLSARENASSTLQLCNSLTEWTIPGALFVLDDLANFPSTLHIVNLGTLALWITSPRPPALTTIRLLLPIGRRFGEITPDVLWFVEFVHRACINCGIHVELSTGVDQHISRSYVPATVELLAAAVVGH